MRTAFTTVFALAIGLTASLGMARQDRQASVLFQQAKIKETVDRDVPGAIQLYEKAASSAGTNRSLKAQSLLRLGLLHKPRDPMKAREILMRVTMEFGDQREADEARKVLSSLNTLRPRTTSRDSDATELNDRLIWQDAQTDTSGRVSFDGRYLSFVDRTQGGALAVKDLTTGKITVLKRANDGVIGSSAISRSGTEVAYGYTSSLSGSGELRVVQIDGSRDRFVYSNDQVVDLQPMDWAPDGRILVRATTRDRASRIATVTANGGDIRHLKTFVFPQRPGNMAFSPDGRYVAYDAPTGDSPTSRAVFALSVDDGFVENSIIDYSANDRVLGWMTDSRIVFASERSGSSSVWAIEAVNGKPGGSKAMKVKETPGQIETLGVTRGGSLFYTSSPREIRELQNVTQELARLQVAALQPQQGQSLRLGSIEGMVVKIGTTEPVAGADVELTRVEGTPAAPLNPGAAEVYARLTNMTTANRFDLRPDPPAALAPEVQFARTGEDGRFVFRNLKPGGYRLVAARAGDSTTATARYGQRDPRGSGLIFPLAEGETMRNANLFLAPTGIITGRVFDAEGQPLGHAYVFATAPVYNQGKRLLMSHQHVLTNDRGEYRFFGLAPGRYYVAAKIEERSEMFISGALPVGRVESGSSPIITRRALPDGSVIEETDRLVYLGGSLDPSLARPIDLGLGSTSTFAGADITMSASKIRSYHIRGVLINGITGQPVSGIQLRAVPQRESTNVFIPIAITDAKGAFDLMGCVPGKYVLVSAGLIRTLTPGQGGQLPPATLTANLALEIGGADMENVRVIATPVTNIQGRVSLEGIGATDKPPKIPGVGVDLFWDPDILGMPNTGAFRNPAARGVSDAEGAFVLQAGVGSYRPYITGMPPNTYVKSIRMGDTDLLSASLRVSGSSESVLDIVISGSTGALDGLAVNRTSDAMPNVVVALVPESPLLRERYDLYKSTSTDARGRFSFRTVPPGSYKIFAWEFAPQDAWQDPSFLQPYESFGKSIRIDVGSSAESQITVIPN